VERRTYPVLFEADLLGTVLSGIGIQPIFGEIIGKMPMPLLMMASPYRLGPGHDRGLVAPRLEQPVIHVENN